ncbi:MAG: hypothetical protein K1X79_11585 [Oligoflexia bacterium]|nr:hypothetical protein [Oligoflexia bacterium]
MSRKYLAIVLVILCGFGKSLICYADEPKAHKSPCERIAPLLDATAKLRNLSSQAPVRCVLLGGAAFRTLLRQKSALSLESDRNIERVFKMLGLIGPDYSYAACMADGASDSVWALYDREGERIVLRSDIWAPDYVVVHELVHALQDRHFGLKELWGKVRRFDQALALGGLVEGDAMYVEELYRLEKGELHDMPARKGPAIYRHHCEPPEELLNILLFPYEWGLLYARKLKTNERDAAFRVPPEATRVLMYSKPVVGNEERKEPVEAVQREAPVGFVPEYSDQLGEFVLRNLLKRVVSKEAAIIAAKGLLSDQLYMFRNKIGKRHLEWWLNFSTQRDVAEMRDALMEYGRKHLYQNGSALQVSVQGLQIVLELTQK